MKKVYRAPRLTTEKVQIGVFGQYGSSGGILGTMVGIWNPLFGLCCS